MIKIICLNGLKRVGKDTYALNTTLPFVHMSVAEELKIGAQRAVGLSSDPQLFEKNKDNKLKILGMKTPRQLWITYAEKFMKPIYGKQVFINKVIDKIQLSEEVIGPAHKPVLIRDVGFYEELDALIETFGAENILLITLLSDRMQAHDDSRIRLSNPDVTTATVYNTGTKEALVKAIDEHVTTFIKR